MTTESGHNLNKNQRIRKKPTALSEVCELYLDFGFEENRENSTEDDSCYLGKRVVLRRVWKSSDDESSLVRSSTRRLMDFGLLVVHRVRWLLCAP